MRTYHPFAFGRFTGNAGRRRKNTKVTLYTTINKVGFNEYDVGMEFELVDGTRNKLQYFYKAVDVTGQTARVYGKVKKTGSKQKGINLHFKSTNELDYIHFEIYYNKELFISYKHYAKEKPKKPKQNILNKLKSLRK